MKESNSNSPSKPYSSEAIKEICIKAGADDAGLVNLDRKSLEKEREGALYVYPLARSVISILVTNNRENLQSPARYVNRFTLWPGPKRKRGQNAILIKK